MKKFQNAEQRYSKVMIPEGYSLYQIARKLEESKIVSKDMFISVSKNSLNKIDNNDLKKEGYYIGEGVLFPDTYFIPLGSTEEQVVKIMHDRFQEVYSQKFQRIAETSGFKKNEIITIASLIEKEAANNIERKRISGVIYNRLKMGMPLQIDATVIYAINKGERSMNRVTYDDLKVDSPYNTYLYKGLPPAPIASPGEASIEAALYPEKHDFLYYVINGDQHVFSKSYSEHLINVNKFRENR